MNPLDSCRHHIPTSLACPWCNRDAAPKKAILALIKKPFQLYQAWFRHFVDEISDRVQAPACVAVIVEDVNGEVFMSMEGPRDRLKILIRQLDERLKEEEKRNA